MPVIRKRVAVASGGGGAMVTRGSVVFAGASGPHDVYVYEKRATNADGSLATAVATGPVNLAALIVNDISAARYDYRSAALLTALSGGSLPGNATIISALLRIVVLTGSNGVVNRSKFGLERALSPAHVTTAAELGITSGRPRTTLKTWGPDLAAQWVPEAVFNVDLTEQVTEVRALGTAAITKVNWLWLPLTTGYDAGATVPNTNYQIYAYDSDPAKAPQLTVTYEVPA